MDMELLSKILGSTLILLALVSWIDRTTANKSTLKGDWYRPQ